MTTSAAGVRPCTCNGSTLAQCQLILVFSFRFYNKKWKEKKKKNKEIVLPIWPSTATIYLIIENFTSVKRCENNTSIKTSIKHAGSFVSILFVQ